MLRNRTKENIDFSPVSHSVDLNCGWKFKRSNLVSVLCKLCLCIKKISVTLTANCVNLYGIIFAFNMIMQHYFMKVELLYDIL